MDQLLQHLLNGLLLGATYSLLGIGLTLVFGLMSVVNFAHGEFYTLGAYAAFGFAGSNEGEAFVFVRSGGTWTQQALLLSFFCASRADPTPRGRW